MKLLTLLLLSLAFDSGDFRAKYAAVDTMESFNQYVYNGPVRPTWVNMDVFVFQNKEKSGRKYYKVDLSDRSRTEVTKEGYDELLKSADGSSYYNRSRRGGKEIKSPDGKYEAFLRDSNVWLRLLDEEAPYRYVPSGSPVRRNEIQLSFDGTLQDYYSELHWSPDSRTLVSMRRQKIEGRQIPLIESAPSDQVQPKIQWRYYVKPGDALSQARPVVFDIVNRKKIDVDMTGLDNQFSLDFGKWHPESRFFTMEYNRRGHQLYQVIAVDPAGKTRVVTEERTSTFVNYNSLYRRYLPDGSLLWMSERDNWRHLYLVNTVTGEHRQLTKGAWNVRDIYSVKMDENYILFTANGMNAIDEKPGTPKGEDPYNKHLLRLNVKTGQITDLTPEPANHNIVFNSEYNRFTDVYSTPEQPAVSVVRDIEGHLLMEVQKADISELLEKDWTLPEVFVAKGRDGKTDIWGTIYRPSNFNPRKKYPVVEYIYAGPHDSFVIKDFAASYRFTKLMELGFIVVSIDGMGTDNRSKSFHDVCWRNLKDSGFPDRILWIKEAAKKYKHMDISKVGVYGYSAGGQSALQALIHFNDFYKVAVALCGCHDNRMDKIWWNEQWMGYPIGPWYSENSTVDQAHLMKGDLMIANGELDDNVDPTSTLQVVKALMKADKDFTQFYFPGYGHNLGDRYVTRKVFEFFYHKILEK